MINESARSEPAAAFSGDLGRWLAAHAGTGRTLNLGAAPWPLPEDLDRSMVVVDLLASALRYEGIFDQVWLNTALLDAADPATIVRQVFTALKPTGTLLLTVPFGLCPGSSPPRGLYLESVRRMLEPLFHLTAMELVDGYIAASGTRRDRATGVPAFRLDNDERAFMHRELQLDERIRSDAAERVRSGARYRGALARSDALQADLERTRKELAELRRKVERIKPLIAGPLAVVRGSRRLKRSAATGGRAVVDRLRGDQPASVPAATGAGTAPHADPTVLPSQRSGAGTTNAAAEPSWRDVLRAGFEAWLSEARAAEGTEVVVMFSGTTFVQEHRGNRPIRLTKVYIERRCPVFFNYYRWSDKDPLPHYPDQLLFQSPIDATATFLDELLAADFGGKRKVFFASFPHEMMVRHLTAAAQQGWVTVYDARDDWEEFAKVGMAKWYHPGYERYVAVHADVVTAVSRPLARKMSALALDRMVHVVPNALDSAFPRADRHGPPDGPPVVGYFGHLTDKWFDWPLVVDAARRYPGYIFELAGHQQPKLDLPPNVKLLGLLGHDDLAARSRTWSVAIIPFINGPLADAVDPIKIYEYLHLRLPVLTSYFPQCRDYPGTTITEGREEFLAYLPKLVGTDPPEREVAPWLAQNTWECRVDTYSHLAESVRQQGREGMAQLLGADW